jgi:hypothetical protein
MAVIAIEGYNKAVRVHQQEEDTVGVCILKPAIIFDNSICF